MFAPMWAANRVQESSVRACNQKIPNAQKLSSTRICHLRRQKARGEKSCGNQSPWSAKAEKEDRTGQPVVDGHKQFIESSYSARYSKWDDDKAWSSQEWKADKSMDDRTGQPVFQLLRKDTRVPIKFLS